MSYEITATAVEPPKPRVLPPEVNNFVTAFWFTLGFGALLLLILWPDVAGFLPAGFSFTVFLALLGIMVFIGAWVSRGITLGNQTALRVGKFALLLGVLALMLIAIGVIVFKLTATDKTPPGGLTPPSYVGASAFLSSSFLAIAVLLPLLFGMLGFFMSMRDEVDAYFNPPPEEELTEYRQPVVMGREEVAEMLEATPAEGEAELVEAEVQATEAALTEEGSGLESTGEALSESDKAAYDDHDAPLSMGEFELDDEPKPEAEKD